VEEAPNMLGFHRRSHLDGEDQGSDEEEHVNELSELNARLLAEARLEARLKEHVIEKIGLKTQQERLKVNKSESVHKPQEIIESRKRVERRVTE